MAKNALIFNPVAGTLSNKVNLVKELQSLYFSKTGHQLEIFETQSAGHATEIARNLASQAYSTCFAMGGDGTMNEVATGLVGSQTALGLIPIGSGNGLARHLGYQMDPMQALNQTISANRFRMDVGECGVRYFFLAAGVGFEGEVAHLFASQKARGFFQYIRSSALSFFQYKPEKYSILVDGEKLENELFTLVVANGSQYGNNAIIAPGASVCDAHFYLSAVRPFPLWNAPVLFYKLMKGSLPSSPYFFYKTGQKVVFDFNKPTKGHLDGEPAWFEGITEFKVVASALEVLSPKNKTEV
jgi:diacylglycerol kinase (ATP)